MIFRRDCEALLNLAVTLTKILNIKYYEEPFPLEDGFSFLLLLSFLFPFFFPFLTSFLREVEEVNQRFNIAIAAAKEDIGMAPARAYYFYAKFLSRCREVEEFFVLFQNFGSFFFFLFSFFSWTKQRPIF